MQDRIIGPLTMIQFLYAVLGAGASYSLYMSFPKPLSYIIVTPVIALTVCMAFVKVNERPFMDFFVSAIQYLMAPKQRIWHHHANDNLRVVIYTTKKQDSQHAATKKISHDKIAELASRLDK